MDVEYEGNRIADQIKFLTCCRFFERLKVSPNAKSRRLILSQFIQLWQNQYANINPIDSHPSAGRASFYPCLRLLLPEVDRARLAYGLRENALSRLYIKAFGIAPNGPVAQRLNQPVYSGKGTDFADILFEAVRDRCREDNILSLKDANDLLDRLSAAENSEERLDAMTSFLRSATAVEQKWMVRFIVRRRSGCGLGVSNVLQCLHPSAPSLWNVTQNLVILCQRIADIDVKTALVQADLVTPDITLFVPFRPMLCERSNSPELLCESALKLCRLGSVDPNSAQLLLETKYDGERIQIHKSGSTYRYWSRNCLEWTSSYGSDGDLNQGSLTPRLHEAFRVDVHDCILDGEIMAYNTWTAALIPKTCGFDVKRSKQWDSGFDSWFDNEESGTYQPCVVVFDVIYLNGKSLTKTPLLERRRLLKELFICKKSNLDLESTEATTDVNQEELSFLPESILEGTLYISHWCQTPVKVDHVSKVFNRLLDSRQEGLVAKLTVGSSPYLPGRRLHGGWWKLKPDYVEGLLADLDCLVVGGYYLSVLGRKTKRIGHFFCAVRDDRDTGASAAESFDSLPMFLSFCRVSSGLTMKQLKEINQKLRPYWQSYDRKHPNTGLTEWLRVTSERPDVWIAPQHSITFQIHASELNPSSSYAAGLTLRFPRIVAVREDKPWQDCLTMQELQQFNRETEGKMTVNRVPMPGSGSDSEDEMDLNADTSTQIILDQDTYSEFLPSGIDEEDTGSSLNKQPLASSTPVKKRKIRHDDRTSWRNVSASSSPLTTDSTPVSGFLSGMKICLILPAGRQKSELEGRIISVGGKIVQNVTPDTFCVVTDKITAKVKNLIGDHFSGNSDQPVSNAKYNIASLDWLMRTLDRGERLPWRRDDLFAMTEDTASLIARQFDRFGDSFCDLVTPMDLKALCDRIPSTDSPDQVSPVHSFSQWKLTASLLEEWKPLDPRPIGPLFPSYILALSSRRSEDEICASKLIGLMHRLIISDLRRLGAVVLHFESEFTNESIPEVIRFVTRHMGFRDQKCGICVEPTLSHILLFGASTHDNMPLLNALRMRLQDAKLSSFRCLHLVNEAWAKQCISTESHCVESTVDF